MYKYTGDCLGLDMGGGSGLGVVSGFVVWGFVGQSRGSRDSREPAVIPLHSDKMVYSK